MKIIKITKSEPTHTKAPNRRVMTGHDINGSPVFASCETYEDWNMAEAVRMGPKNFVVYEDKHGMTFCHIERVIEEEI